MRIIFMGTSAFAVPTLQLLATSVDIKVDLVISQPDRPSGRGMRFMQTPVSATATSLGLSLEKPERLRLISEKIVEMKPDALVVVSYGQILSNKVLNAAVHGGINLHASLLPRWRGAAPIHRALASGDMQTGVATMRMERSLDTGAVLLEESVDIQPHHDSESLEAELSLLGAPLMLETLRQLRIGAIVERQQDHEQACYAHMLTREDGHLDFQCSTSSQIDLAVRAFAKRPGTSVMISEKVIKVHAGYATVIRSESPPGTVIGTNKDGLVVATQTTDYVVTVLQPHGKPAMPALAYANGARLSYPLEAIKPSTFLT